MNLSRKLYNLFALSTIFVFLCQLMPPQTEAFKTAWPFENVHLQIIQAALQPLGFQPPAIAKINEGHSSLDKILSYKFWIDEHHCDGNHIKEGYSYFLNRLEKAIGVASDAYKNPVSADDARFAIGEGYHALQDFYSHSNWIEMQYYDNTPVILFPWHLYVPWQWNKSTSEWEHSWSTKPEEQLPYRLKTGYFGFTEFTGEGKNLLRGSIWGAGGDKSTRGEMVSALVEEYKKKNPPKNLQFHSDAEYVARIQNANNFRAAIEYAVKDPGRAMLHLELNKDNESQRESVLVTPDGETLFQVAKRLATEDTNRTWRVAEKEIWKKYDDKAALILPAIKGNPIPELKVKVNLDATQQARNRPLRGSISLGVKGLPSPMRMPLKVKLKAYLKPQNEPDTAQDQAPEQELEYSADEEKSVGLESLNLVIGNKKGRFDLVVRAWFDCDPEFKPFRQRIPLGSGSLLLHSAKYTPNPAFIGEEIKLDVDYTYESSGASATGEGSGTIEKADGSYRHTIAKQPLPAPTGSNQIYSDKWTPPQGGKYFWYPKLTFNNTEEAASVVEINVGDPGFYKDIKGECSLNKNEFAIGENVILTIKYKIRGIGRDPITVKETSQIDGPATQQFPESTPTLTSRAGEAVERVKTYTYPASKSGVYDWRFAIEAAGFESFQDTLRFTVKGQKRLVIDNATVSPESGPPGPVRLHVDYHLGGMDAGTSQEAIIDSRITGPAGQTFPQSRQTVASASGSGAIDLSFPGTTPGDYVWNTDIDAGPFGKEQRALAFRIEDNTVRSIDLISATVTPVKGVVGTTHTLEVWYKLVGMKPNETVEVHENDYLSYGKQKSNPTVTKNVTEPNVNVRKVAGFVSEQAGKHTWNFIIDAKGFRTLYGAVNFDAFEEEVKPKLRARLQYPMITLAPGETKNCTIYISGQKTDTQDRVEIVYPEISDNWGTLPGQVQVFPGTTSMDPWSMRGAGDYTKEYAAGQGYRAKVTAPPGVTPVKIIVKQKDVGQVTLTLFVKIVKKGDSTIGTEIENPRLPGTYIPKARRPGSENPLSGPGEVETDRGTVGPDGVTRTPDGNQNGPGSTQPGDRASNNNNNNQDQSNPDSTNNSNNGPVTWTGPRGVSIPSAPTSNTGPSPGTTKGQSNQTYVFSRAIFEKKIESGNLGISATSTSGGVSQGTVTTGRVARVPISTTYKNSMSYEAPITEIVSGDVSVTFPHDFVLVSNQARISASATANASIERTGEQRLHEDEPEKYTHDITISVGSSSPNTLTVASKPFMRNGRTNLNGGWEIPLSFSGQNGAKELSATIGNGYVKIGDGAYLHLKNVYYVLQGTEDKSKKGDSTEEAKDDKNTSPDEEKELTAWLENPSITLVAGRLPSTSSHIKIKGWKRDVSSPVEVIFPGQTFGNNLPDDLIVNPGGGSQDPSALSAISSDEGVYTWTQGFEAKIQAKPGVYQVPIIVRQAGAGQIQLVLNVTVEKNKNLRQGVINDGQTQALLNKSQPWNVPPEKKDESKPGWNLPQPHTAPSSSWNVPSTPHAQPAPGWNVPSTPPAQTAPGWNVPTTTTSKPGWNVPTTTHTQPSPGWNVPTTTHTQPSPGWNVPTTTHAQPSPGWNVPTTTHAQPSPGWNVPTTPTAPPPPPPPPPPPKPQVWNPPSTTPTTSPGWNVPTTTAPPRPTTQVQVTENYEGIYQREDDPTFKLRIYRDGGGLGAEWIQHPFATGKQVFGNAQRTGAGNFSTARAFSYGGKDCPNMTPQASPANISFVDGGKRFHFKTNTYQYWSSEATTHRPCSWATDHPRQPEDSVFVRVGQPQSHTPPVQSYTPPPPPPPAPTYASPPPSTEGSPKLPRFFVAYGGNNTLGAAELVPSPNPNLFEVRIWTRACPCKGAFNVRLNVLKANCQSEFGDRQIIPAECTYNQASQSLQCRGAFNLTMPSTANAPTVILSYPWTKPNFGYMGIPMPAVTAY